jgi:hypothetical protein
MIDRWRMLIRGVSFCVVVKVRAYVCIWPGMDVTWSWSWSYSFSIYIREIDRSLAAMSVTLYDLSAE